MTNEQSTPSRPSSLTPKRLLLWQSTPLLAGVAPEIIQTLSELSARHTYEAGAIIFGEGEPVAGLFLIEVGSVKVCRFSKEGREHTLRVFQPGETFNEVPVLDGGPNAATAIAFTDAVVWRIPRTDLQAVALRYPALAWILLESIARRTRYLVGLVQDLSARHVKSRLARLLLEQAQGADAQPAPLLTQEEMASRLGTVREVVGRALRHLAASGIIQFERHRIVILDAERLAEEAEL